MPNGLNVRLPVTVFINLYWFTGR